MVKTPILFTKQGHKKLTLEHHILLSERTHALVNLKTAREMGDLSENAAYRVARAKLSSIDRRIRYLTQTLDRAVIVSKHSEYVIGIGSIVSITSEGHTATYTIVGSHESDILNKLLSYISPVGRALMGKRINDTVSVVGGSGKNISYTITALR